MRGKLWRRFRLGLEPLRQAGKLGVVLLQFAPRFVFRHPHSTQSSTPLSLPGRRRCARAAP